MKPVAALALLLCGNALLAQAPAPNRANVAPLPFELPAPTGMFPVGTTSWRLQDSARRETFVAGRASREVEVVAWYPAASARGGDTAPYLRWGLFEVRGFATRLGEPAAYDHLAGVRTHAIFDAPLADTPERLPVIVFAAGYGGFPSAHTALLEDLASHGYAVLNVVHPYEAGAARLASGQLVSFFDATANPRQPYLDVVGEWGKEDDTMAEVTRAASEDDQRRMLRSYFARTPRTALVVRRWVDDTRRALDKLASLPRASAGGRLVARLDLARVGISGHSMGGVVAGQFCADDPRCKAGLNLDGIPQFGNVIDKTSGPPFLMTYSARPGRLGASDAIYRRAAKPYYRVDVAGTGHLDFSDMIFWGGPLRDRSAFGTLAPERIAAITRTIVLEYFDQTLLGRPSALLGGRSPFAEVTVKTP